ncbi:hypothetical protein [Pseudarthrobacter sp. PS3-L1]|uniref:hypothetical protein n=1 Tax=Pseudarthrobacter sp. PS3-L1 TaxID=3046207 RepID=UPI0024BA0B9A|nr:hypothetical protein [Pseudarthrobacter sp. PS3-L1]MDJ0321661.1 hypothetical protein [Pseudarthrobacter sp. PS3-L1]
MSDGQTVDRLRRGTVIDPYSQEPTLADWDSATVLELEGVAIAPSSSSETVADNRGQVITQMSIYCGVDQDVAEHDRIRDRNVLWEVQGEVAQWRNPFTGWAPGAEFSIRKVTG